MPPPPDAPAVAGPAARPTAGPLTVWPRRARRLRDLAADAWARRHPPVILAGLPRSGTTWLAEVLATARGVQYIHEPFNITHRPAARPHYLTYATARHADPAFEAYAREAFSGRVKPVKGSGPRGKAHPAWWPTRLVVKDVHTPLALEWVDRHVSPQVVIATRHPCAVASSWLRLRRQLPKDFHWQDMELHLQPLLAQPALVEGDGPLAPFRDVLRSAETYLERFGAYWGACYHVILRQRAAHPAWTLVPHEALCVDPDGEFRRVFERLHLRWSPATTAHLAASTTTASDRPYVAQRVSAEEPDKWRRELTEVEVEEVRRFVRPYKLGLYEGF